MCSPFWVSFFREINWQSEKIYQHIARLSDKLKLWGNQLWPCRCVQPPPPPSPPPHNAQEPGKSWVGQTQCTYLFIWDAHSSAVTNDPGGWRPLNPQPPLPQTGLVCEEGAIIIKNTQIREEQWILLQAGEGKRRCELFFILWAGHSACYNLVQELNPQRDEIWHVKDSRIFCILFSTKQEKKNIQVREICVTCVIEYLLKPPLSIHSDGKWWWEDILREFLFLF